MTRQLLMGVLLTLAGFGLAAPARAAQVPWTQDLAEAYKQALKEKKPIFVFVYDPAVIPESAFSTSVAEALLPQPPAKSGRSGILGAPAVSTVATPAASTRKGRDGGTDPQPSPTAKATPAPVRPSAKTEPSATPAPKPSDEKPSSLKIGDLMAPYDPNQKVFAWEGQTVTTHGPTATGTAVTNPVSKTPGASKTSKSPVISTANRTTAPRDPNQMTKAQSDAAWKMAKADQRKEDYATGQPEAEQRALCPETIASPEVIGGLQGVLAVRLNKETASAELLKRLDVTQFPTYIFYYHTGHEYKDGRLVGDFFRGPDVLRQLNRIRFGAELQPLGPGAEELLQELQPATNEKRPNTIGI